MANVSVAILGMGRIGASAALALKRYNERKDAQHQFELFLADMRAGVREDAAKIGITSKIENNLFNVVGDKDIVLLALPYAEVEAVYKNLATEMRPGVVLLDTSPIKVPSLAWAKKYLPAEVHMVGLTPILNPAYLFDGLDDTLHARADLFDKGDMLLMPAVSAIKDAVELATDFSTLLGAKPHFVDPVEHDGIMAAAEGLPSTIGATLFYMLAKSQGWVDTQRMTNPTFGRITHHLYDTHPDDLRDIWLNNRDHMVRQLDNFIEAMFALRQSLAAGDRNAVESLLIDSSDMYSEWINRRHNAEWDDDKLDSSGVSSIGSMLMNGLMGGALSKRLTGKNGDKD